MTVGELKRMLEHFDDAIEVVMSSDAEGNGMSPLAELTDQRYVPESTWSGELDHEAEPPQFNAVVFWPTR